MRGTEIGPYWLYRISGLARLTTLSFAPVQPQGFLVINHSFGIKKKNLDISISEGPIAQTGAPYAKVPGIRVYGMLCRVNGKKRRRKARVLFQDQEEARFPSVPDYMWDIFN